MQWLFYGAAMSTTLKSRLNWSVIS